MNWYAVTGVVLMGTYLIYEKKFKKQQPPKLKVVSEYIGPEDPDVYLHAEVVSHFTNDPKTTKVELRIPNNDDIVKLYFSMEPNIARRKLPPGAIVRFKLI